MRPPVEGSLTLRLAAEADREALLRLAALDSAHVPPAPVLVAEAGGPLLAAVSLSAGGAVADPFSRTAEVVELLRVRAGHLCAKELAPARWPGGRRTATCLSAFLSRPWQAPLHPAPCPPRPARRGFAG